MSRFVIAYQPSSSHSARKIDAGDAQPDAERTARELTEESISALARVYQADPQSYGYKFVASYRNGKRGTERS